MKNFNIALCYTDITRGSERCDSCEEVEECKIFTTILSSTDLRGRESLHKLVQYLVQGG